VDWQEHVYHVYDVGVVERPQLPVVGVVVVNRFS